MLFIHFYIFIFTTYILIVNNFTLIIFLRLILVVLDWYLKVRAELKLLFNINVKENLWFLVQEKCRKNDFQNILKQPVFLKMFLAKNIFPLKTFYAKQTKASKSVALIMVTSFVLHIKYLWVGLNSRTWHVLTSYGHDCFCVKHDHLLVLGWSGCRIWLA